MAVTLYTQDVKRPISIYPQMDATGAIIAAKVYNFDTDEFLGYANTRKPFDEDLYKGKVTLDLDITSNTGISVDITVKGKQRHETSFTNISTGTVTNATIQSAFKAELEFDPGQYDDFAFTYTFTTGVEGTDYNMNQSSIETYPISNLDDLVVGGAAGEEVVVPLDGRDFTSGQYSIVFVAEDVGVVARDILLVFADDGYSV